MQTATALQIPAFGIAQLKTASVPVGLPGPFEVLVELHAASLNYRDLMIVQGTYDPKLQMPRVPGSDAAGVVTAVGDGVTRFKVGDRVCSLFFQTWQEAEILAATGKSALGGPIDGVFTTERLFAEAGLIHAPAGMSHEEAATLPCAALTAWNALVEKGKLRAGETVLVLGTGGVSLFALQIAKMHGARVILTSSSDEKLARGRALGADETINYREHPEWDAEVFKLTNKRGVDHVVEVGGNGTLPRSLRAVRVSGQVHLIGVLSGGGSEVDVRQIFAKSIYVNGVYVGSAAMFARMNAALQANAIRPVIDRVFPLSEARLAFEHLQSGNHFGKIVLSLRS